MRVYVRSGWVHSYRYKQPWFIGISPLVYMLAISAEVFLYMGVGGGMCTSKSVCYVTTQMNVHRCVCLCVAACIDIGVLLAAALGAHRSEAMRGFEVGQRSAAPDRSMCAIGDHPEESIEGFVMPCSPS